MNKAFYRAAAGVMTAAMALGVLTGCAKNGSNGGGIGNRSKGGKIELSFEHSYASEKVDIQKDMQQLQDFIVVGDKLLVAYYDKDFQEKFLLYNPADGSSKEVHLQAMENPPEGGETHPQSIVQYPDGLGFLYTSYKWENEGTENEEYVDLGYSMEIYDSEMNLKETKDLSGLSNDENGMNFNEIYAIPAGGYIATGWDNATGNQCLMILDDNLKQSGTINADMQYTSDLVVLPSGTIAVSYQDSEWNNCFGTIDPATKELTKIDIEGVPMSYDSIIPSSDSKYDLYLKDSTALYGVSLSSGKCEEVINWINSDFIGDYVGTVTQLADGRFLIVSNSANYDSADVWALTPRDPKEFENVTMISCSAMYLDDTLSQAINEFNRTHSDYRIGVYSYQQFVTNDENGWENAIEKFNNDMTSGVVADLICTSGLDFASLANKGIFVDLTDKTAALSDADYFTNVFKAKAYGEKQYAIPFSFQINTLACKSKYCGGKQGLTVAEFNDMIKNMPSGMEPLTETSKDGALSTFVTGNLNAYINVDDGTCTFNSPDFVTMLEFCNSFPEESGDKSDMSDSEWEKYWAEQAYQYINDKVLFSHVWISSIRDTYRDLYTNFDDEDVTLVGFPTSGSGTNGASLSTNFELAISSGSEHQDVCWEFMQSMLSEDFQESLSWQIPVSRKAFDKKIAEEMKPQTYTDENGQEVRYDDTIWRGDEEVKMPEMPKEFADSIKDYIAGITESGFYDEKIANIISEEAGKFFAGDQSAQQAADMIQSRASLYLSEQH